MSKRIVILLIVLLPALLFAGGKKEGVSEKPVVVVSILPHAFFVRTGWLGCGCAYLGGGGAKPALL